MRAVLVLVVGLGAIVAQPGEGIAKCGDGPNDATQTAMARAEVDTTCAPCATFTSHGAYVRCAIGVARNRELGGMLRAECVRAVKRCAAKSTCGRPGTVTCCTTRPDGEHRCRIRPSATCTAPACAGAATSCCDACDLPPCVATTTSTTSQSTTSTTIAGVPCTGGSPAPTCDGACPSGSHCEPTSEFGSFDCACFPDDTTPCGNSAYPQCGGACLNGLQCIPVRVTDFSTSTAFCFCVGPGAECANPGTTMCSAQFPGPCPPGQVCGTFLCGPGCADCGCGPP